MKYATIILMLLPALLWAQPFEFQQEMDSISAIVDGDTLATAWTGGYSMATPDLCDIDGDGDFDIMLGASPGQIAFWENRGTTSQSSFELANAVFQGIDSVSVAEPEFWDMDADGDFDLFLYAWTTGLQVYENIGSSTAPSLTLLESTLVDVSGNPIIVGGGFDLADIDADGDKDLFCGTWYTGKIKYYQNIGDSTQFAFFLADSNFAGIYAGEACPAFCDIDADGDLDLFIGINGGWIYYYRNDGTPQEYNYTFVTYQWMGIDVAENASPEFCDIDADGDYDLFIGKDNDETYAVPGALHFWRNIGTPQMPQMIEESQMYLTLDFGIVSEPGTMDVNFDAKGDLFVHSYYTAWLKDVGTATEPVFELQNYNTTGSGSTASSFGLGDLNGDGYEDMVIVYGWSGNVQFWMNNGDTLNPEFNYFSSMSIGQLAGGPELVDMDADGDNDMVIHVSSYQFEPYVYYYENQGDPLHFNFVLSTTNYQGWAGYCAVLSILDFDGDGDFDVVAEEDTTGIMVYMQNMGTPQSAIFGAPVPMDFINFDTYDVETCDFCDVDHDGDMDAFFGSILGGLKFFRNVTGETPAVPPPLPRTAPYRGPVLEVGPNPANPVTILSFELRVASSVNLEVYDISGRKVAELLSGRQEAGAHVVTWDASGLGSGVYLARLQVGGESQAGKVVVVVK